MAREEKSRRGTRTSSGRGGDGEERDTLRRRGEEMVMNLAPWMPFGNMPMSPADMVRRYTQEMDRMFENWGFRGPSGLRWPAIEMFERENEMVIRVELSGMNPDDVRVRTFGDMLVIEGERRTERERGREGMQRSEWSYGQFSRQIPLSSDLDAEAMSARMHDGVLEITVPFTEERQSRDIPIQRGEGMPPSPESRGESRPDMH